MVDDIEDRLERGRSPVAKGPFAEDGRSIPGRELVEPTGDMDGHKDEARARGLGDGLHLQVHLLAVVGVGRLDQQKGGAAPGRRSYRCGQLSPVSLLMDRQGGSPFGIFGRSVHEKKGRGRLLVVDIFPLVVLDDLLGALLLASGIDDRVAVGLARGAGRGLLVLGTPPCWP